MVNKPGRVFVQTNPAIDFRFISTPAGAEVFRPGVSWLVPASHTYTSEWIPEQKSTGRRWRINLTVKGNGTGNGNFAGCGPGPMNFDSVTATVSSVTPLD